MTILEEAGVGLFSTTQIAPLTAQGFLPVPTSTKYLLMEIGVSDFETMDEQELPLYPNGFLFAFEPLLEKYAHNLAKGSRRYHGAGKIDLAVPLAQYHERAMLLPIAISTTGGPMNITVMKRAGCSSINGPVLLSARNSSGRICQDPLEVRRVDTITLEDALRLVGPLPIRRLKIDAEGIDLRLIKATGTDLLRSRVYSIQLEARTAQCERLYEGQESCDDVLAYMRKVGYTSRHPCPPRSNKLWCIRSMVFYARGMPRFDPSSDFCSGGVKSLSETAIPVCCPRACRICVEDERVCMERTRARNATFHDQNSCCPQVIRDRNRPCGDRGMQPTASCVLPQDRFDAPFL